MKSYDDMDDDMDDEEFQGCLRPVLAALAVVLAAVIVVFCAVSCRSCPCPPDMAEIYEVLSAP